MTTQTTKARPHPRKMLREVFIDEVNHKCTMIKVTGPEHEECAAKIVRSYHAEHN